MRWPSEIPEPEPCEPDLGTPEDWKRIEEELEFEGFDPRRREHLWRDIAEIFNACLADERMGVPDVRPANYRHALQTLRRHAVRLFVDLSPSGDLIGSGDGTIEGVLQHLPVCDPEDAPPDGLNELDQGAMVFLSLDILPSDKHRALLEGLAELIAAVDQRSKALLGVPPLHCLHATVGVLMRVFAALIVAVAAFVSMLAPPRPISGGRRACWSGRTPRSTRTHRSTSNIFNGTAAALARARFKEVDRRSPALPVMRHDMKALAR
jgi:hypothetical protein